MKKFTKIFLIMIIASPVIGLMVTSCADEADCSLVNRATLTVSIYRLNDSEQWVAGTLDSLTITALGTDSTILNRGSNVNYFTSLPLQYTVDTTAIVLHFSSRIRDTLFFSHTNTPYFLSMDCGYDMNQTITELTYTKNFLDSISIRNYNTSKNETENLRLYID